MDGAQGGIGWEKPKNNGANIQSFFIPFKNATENKHLVGGLHEGIPTLTFICEFDS